MYRYFAYTTVDVTQTNVRTKTQEDDWCVHRNQQRNLDTFVQALGLRSQPLNVQVDCIVGRPTKFGLGSNLPEVATIWEISFDIEHDQVFGQDCELALKDLNYVPIINGLEETEPAFPPVFQSTGTFKNVHIFFAKNQ